MFAGIQRSAPEQIKHLSDAVSGKVELLPLTFLMCQLRLVPVTVASQATERTDRQELRRSLGSRVKRTSRRPD